MALSAPFSTKWMFAGHVFVKNTCTEFHRNPMVGLIADTVKDGRCLHITRLEWALYGNELGSLKYLSVCSNCDLFLEIMGTSSDDMLVCTCVQFR
jgi:hypothetical protein